MSEHKRPGAEDEADASRDTDPTGRPAAPRERPVDHPPSSSTTAAGLDRDDAHGQ